MKVGKKTRIGVVVSDKASKTVQVSVLRTKKEGVLGKVMKLQNKYAAHDEKEEALPGSIVEIEECRPISKTKKWKVVRIIQKAAGENIELKDELEALKPVVKPAEKSLATEETKATDEKGV